MNQRKRVSALTIAILAGTSLLAAPTTARAGGSLTTPERAHAVAGAAHCEMSRTGEYPEAAAAAVGLDAHAVQAALDYFVQQGAENTKVFRHGCLVAHGALDPLTNRVPRQNWSQTKTVSTLIAGVAEREGLIAVDDPIGKYLPSGIGDARHRAITIRSVLNMTTGQRMNWTRGLNFFTDIDRTRQVMADEMVHKPGAYFEYDQDTPSILNFVVQQAVHQKIDPRMDYQDFAQKEFFNKLGIPASAYWWQRERSGNTLGYSQLFLRPLEFGRLGELMLNEGVFAGERMINKSFMKQLATGSVANCGYGFMVWTNGCTGNQHQVTGSIFTRREINPARAWIQSAPSDMYYSWGYHGQHTFVIPSLDMVITRSGERPTDSDEDLKRADGDLLSAGEQKGGYHQFFRMLMSAVTDMTPAQSKLIANRGACAAACDAAANFDPDTYLYPMDTAAGSYLAVGPSAPQGCTFMGCDGASNDGTQRWLTDVPRTFPGVLGEDTRPKG